MEEVSHKEIYERLLAVEVKVDKMSKDTEGLVTAFHAAEGAFIVLEWVAKVAKPLLWLAALIAAGSALIHNNTKL